MKLHDSLTDAVADVSADLPALVSASRRQGMGLRRRRRALASVGTAAAVLAVGVGGLAVAHTVGGHGDRASEGWVAASPTSGATAPLTGRGVAAALASAVADVSDGTPTDFRGTGRRGGEPMGELLLTPATGGAAGLVQIDLQRLASYGRPQAYLCDQAYMHGCTVQRLADGDTLRTYTDESSGSARAYRRYVAEVLSASRDLRLVLGASNTGTDEKHATRAEPVLTAAQLRAIALRPWWDRTRLPVEYVDAGERLPSYADLG